MKKIIVVAGTRPEVIKVSPVYFALREQKGIEPLFLATAQHRQMLDQALTGFDIQPEYDLNLMQPGQSLQDLTSRTLTSVTELLRAVRPSAVLVQGDTTTVLASAMAAFYEGIPIGHIEAGLRTGNMYSPFPEEMNRRLTTPLARWHFCPTELSRDNLLREGIAESQIHVTGNTVIDALYWMRSKLNQDSLMTAQRVAERCGINADFYKCFLQNSERKWILVTGHRRESFGTGFENICLAIKRLTELYPDVGVLYPVHLNPRVQEPVKRILGGNKQVALISPVGYQDFIWLMDRCHFVLSDSGGVQEEAPSLGKPVLVMRETTERPEGVAAGTCVLVGTNPDTIVREVGVLLSEPGEYQRRSQLKNPYGDGTAAAQIARILAKDLA